MDLPLYALVAYVKSPVGRFVEDLRRDLHPEHPELPAHLTVLPPRRLQGTAEAAQSTIEEVCRGVEPFEVVMGDVETFIPITPTVFIRVAHAAYRLRDLHDKLNVGPLQYDEPWPYMPHLTIAKLDDLEVARDSAEAWRNQWSQFGGSRRILIDELTFVREGTRAFTWVDLAPIPLGNRLPSPVG